MSYWDIHEATQGKYDFKELDWQFAMAKRYGADISLAIGLRQPRWPESHWPAWAQKLPESDWQQALFTYIETVVMRYKDHPCLKSWQLENEAMLKTFGQNGNFDRSRLKREYALVKKLDPKHPVIMSTSDSWGMPFFGPRPDIYAFSIYRYFFDKGSYRHATRPPVFYRLRASFIRLLKWRPVFIHELQTEPWGPVATVNMPLQEQYKSIGYQQVVEAVTFARRTGLQPIDIWGLEWWYYLGKIHNDKKIWQYMTTVFAAKS